MGLPICIPMSTAAPTTKDRQKYSSNNVDNDFSFRINIQLIFNAHSNCAPHSLQYGLAKEIDNSIAFSKFAD